MSDQLEHKEFDKLINEHYKGHEIVPSNSLWDKIDAHNAEMDTTNKYKKRFGFLLWFSGVVVVLMVGTIIYYEWDSDKTLTAEESSALGNPEKQINDGSRDKGETNFNESEKESFNANNKSSKNNEKETSNGSNVNSIIITPGDDAKIRSTGTGSVTSTTAKSNDVSEKSGEKINTSYKSEDGIPGKDQGMPIERKNKNTSRAGVGMVGNPNQNTDSESKVLEPESGSSTELKISNDATENSSDKGQDMDPESSLATNNEETHVDIDSAQIVHAPDAELAISASETTHSADLPSPPKTPSRVTLTAYFSPEYSHRVIKNNSTGSDQNISTSDLDKAEKGALTYSFGAAVGYDIDSKWTLKAGISYSAYNRQFNRTDVTATIDTISGESDFVSSLGVITLSCEEFKDLEEEESESVVLSINAKQKFNFIHIPISTDYRIGSGKAKMLISAGVSTDIIVANKQDITVTGGEEFEDLTITQPNGFRKVNFSGMVGVGGEFNVFKGLSAIVQPTFRVSFTSLNTDALVLSYPYSFGLTTGLKYRF